MLIAVDAPQAPDIAGLIRQHLSDNYAVSPADSVHALGVEALTDPRITLWSARDAQTSGLLGIGALLRHSPVMAELKSMRTDRAARRRGVGSKILAAIIAECQREGVQDLKLETGAEDYFAPARAMYVRAGFISCAPFASYSADPHSVFMSLRIDDRDDKMLGKGAALCLAQRPHLPL